MAAAKENGVLMNSLEWMVDIDSPAIILKAFQKIMPRYFGIKVTQKGRDNQDAAVSRWSHRWGLELHRR